MKVICHKCEKEFETTKYRVDKNKNNFCSRKCQLDFQKRETVTTLCAVCPTPIIIKRSQFNKTKGNLCCSRKCRGVYLKTHYKGDNNPNSHKHSPLEVIFCKRVDAIKSKCTKDNLPFDLDIESMCRLYERQNGECYYTGYPMRLVTEDFAEKKQAAIDVMSVDRIIPEKGYIKGNIRLCCNGINKFRGNANTDEFEQILSFIKNSRKKSSVKIFKKHEKSYHPLKISSCDIGYNLLVENIEIINNSTFIDTGLDIEIPKGLYGEILFHNDLYGESDIFCGPRFISPLEKTRIKFEVRNGKTKIKKGDVLGRLEIRPYEIVNFIEEITLTETERGDKGYGSSDKPV